MEPLLLKISDAARVLGVGRTTAYELVREGTLPHVVFGGRMLVPAEELHALVRQLRVNHGLCDPDDRARV